MKNSFLLQFFRVKGQIISSTKKKSKVADAKAFLLQISVTKLSLWEAKNEKLLFADKVFFCEFIIIQN